MKARAPLMLVLLAACVTPGSAMQHSGMSPAPEGTFDTIPGSSRHDEDFGPKFKFSEKDLNVLRHKRLTQEAAELVNLAGELQLKAQKSPEDQASHEAMLRQVEAIEKLAHSVKERMKGSR